MDVLHFDVLEKTFRCPKGHTEKGSNPTQFILSPEDKRYPFCRVCYGEWLETMFSISEVG